MIEYNNKKLSFDYTTALRHVCEDVCFRVPELRHIDMPRVGLCFTHTKHSRPHDSLAKCVPLRFENGQRYEIRGRRTWTIDRRYMSPEGTEYLYLLYVYGHRFIELPLSEKFDTIVHELYHIGPKFDGDMRRFRGRNYAHGSSKKNYDIIIQRLLKYYLQQDPPEGIWDFLTLNYQQLTRQYGQLTGAKLPMPKLIPLIGNH